MFTARVMLRNAFGTVCGGVYMKDVFGGRRDNHNEIVWVLYVFVNSAKKN